MIRAINQSKAWILCYIKHAYFQSLNFPLTYISSQNKYKNSITQKTKLSDRKHQFCIKQSFENDSYDEQRFEIKHTSKHNFRLKLGKS